MVPAPKAALFHDLCGYGRCSLAVVLPVLSAMGCQCCCAPTAYLSAHTGYPASNRAVFLDLTDQLAGTCAHWAELGAEFGAVYSGFLGSPGQIAILKDFIARSRRMGALVLTDPVMGDHGRPYRTCTPELRQGVAELAALADVITPNLTEAALLLGEAYDPAPDDEKLRRWLEALTLEGRRSVVITGVRLAEGRVGAACMDRSNGWMNCAMAPEEPARFPGTGDLYAAVLLGGLLRGEDLPAANGRAVDFVWRCVHRTLALGTPVPEGVQLEGLLAELN